MSKISGDCPISENHRIGKIGTVQSNLLSNLWDVGILLDLDVSMCIGDYLQQSIIKQV